jgi:quinol monooxygenase YgiN
MNHQVISYKTKPDAAQKNADLIKDVFRELQATAPKGVSYTVLQSEDGAFYHLVSYQNEETQGAIPKLAAFQTFQKEAAPLRVSTPEFTDVKIVGSYGTLAD